MRTFCLRESEAFLLHVLTLLLFFRFIHRFPRSLPNWLISLFFSLSLLAHHHTYSLPYVGRVGKMRRGVFSNLALGANCGVAQRSVYAVCFLSPHEHLPLTDACARHLQVFASLLKHKNASFFFGNVFSFSAPAAYRRRNRCLQSGFSRAAQE